MQPSDVRPELGLGFGDGVGQRLGARALRHVGDRLGEPRPLLLGELVGAELVDRLLGQCEELVLGEMSSSEVPTISDVRRQVGLVQVGQAGQQLALGQVARRAEQHDDVRVDRDSRRGGVGVRRVRDRRWSAVCLSPPPAYFHRRNVHAPITGFRHREVTSRITCRYPQSASANRLVAGIAAIVNYSSNAICNRA